MSDPLVSVVIPTYGRPEFLREAIESVEQQTYRNVEVLVVDDHSPEPVEQLLDDVSFRSDGRLRFIRHDENQGASAARNTGIEASEGSFIAFLDDDDYWMESKLQRQVDTFANASDDVGLVYTGQKFVADGKTASVWTPSLRGDVTTEMLAGAEIGTFSTVMVRAAVPEVVGELDERFPCWQDREWLLRVSVEYEFEPVREPLAVRRSSEHEQISDDFEAKRDVAYPLFLEEFRPLAAEYGPEHERALLAAQSRALGRAGVRHGYFSDGRTYLLKSLRYDPTDAQTYVYLLASLGGKFTLRPAQFVRRTINQYTS